VPELVVKISLFPSQPFRIVIPYKCRSVLHRWPDAKHLCDRLTNCLSAVRKLTCEVQMKNFIVPHTHYMNKRLARSLSSQSFTNGY